MVRFMQTISDADPLISHRSQACLDCFLTLCTDKLIRYLVSLSLHSISVDSCFYFDHLLFLASFLEGCLLRSLLLGPLGVLVSVVLNLLKFGGSGPG